MDWSDEQCLLWILHDLVILLGVLGIIVVKALCFLKFLINDQMSSPVMMGVRNWDKYWQRIKSCAFVVPCILSHLYHDGAGQKWNEKRLVI